MVELDEVWVEVGIGEYEVSSYGRVYNGKTRRYLRPNPDKNGYHRVILRDHGRRHDTYIHRLVARAFFLNYKSGIEVRHKNEDKNDNSVLNLTLGGGCRKSSGIL